MKYSTITQGLTGLGTDKWAVHVTGLEKRQAGEKVYLLSIGEPDFAPPQALIGKTIEQIHAGRLGYSSGRGEDAFLDAVCHYYAQRSGRPISREQVIFTAGTQNALFVALLAVAERGDEVIVPEPCYATYEGVVAATGATRIPLETRPEDGFHLKPDALEAAITDNTTALMFNSPSNPIGAVPDRRQIGEIGEICRAHNIWLISDEVYADFTYAGVDFASPFDRADLADITIVASSISKTHAVPGFRAGWLVGSEEFSNRALPISEAMLFGAQPFLQDATAYALTTRFNESQMMRQAYETRAREMVDALNAHPGINCHMPKAGMFVFADIRETGLSGDEFAQRLLEETNVCVMPGESFGQGGGGHIRLSLTQPDDDLREATRLIGLFLNRLAGV